MPVKLAKKVGFCFGVKRAVDMAGDVLCKEAKVYSLGSIIHNRQVVDILSEKGLKVIGAIDEAKDGVIVISSHGISPKVADEISRRSLKLVDTTCPFVRSAQDIARSLNDSGYRIIIVGDADHPEVKALVDFAGRNARVVKDVRSLKALKLKPGSKVGVLSQTTQSMGNFLSIVRAIIDTRPKSIKVFNTICRDAEDRQEAARQLSRKVDLMLIVGGKNSANTKRLFEVCRNIRKRSYLIEDESGLKDTWFRGARVIGVTSGASTPGWIVKRVINAVRTKIKS